MNFAYSGGTAQQLAWAQNAVSLCTYPLDNLSVNVTVQWVDSFPSGLDSKHPYMFTGIVGDDYTINIGNWADDPTDKRLQGLPDPAADIQNFYQASVVHEIGHVVSYATFDPGDTGTDPRVADMCALFWRPIIGGDGRRYGTPEDYDASSLAWADEIREAVAEWFKLACSGSPTVFWNRTNWTIDVAQWATMWTMLLPPDGSTTLHLDVPVSIDLSMDDPVPEHTVFAVMGEAFVPEIAYVAGCNPDLSVVPPWAPETHFSCTTFKAGGVPTLFDLAGLGDDAALHSLSNGYYGELDDGSAECSGFSQGGHYTATIDPSALVARYGTGFGINIDYEDTTVNVSRSPPSRTGDFFSPTTSSIIVAAGMGAGGEFWSIDPGGVNQYNQHVEIDGEAFPTDAGPGALSDINLGRVSITDEIPWDGVTGPGGSMPAITGNVAASTTGDVRAFQWEQSATGSLFTRANDADPHLALTMFAAWPYGAGGPTPSLSVTATAFISVDISTAPAPPYPSQGVPAGDMTVGQGLRGAVHLAELAIHGRMQQMANPDPNKHEQPKFLEAQLSGDETQSLIQRQAVAVAKDAQRGSITVG